MPKTELPPSEALYPEPVVLVTCSDTKTKKTNIITIAWCGVVCSNPPLISISVRPSRYSHRLIQEAGEFVINIPSKAMASKVDLCGIRSGRDMDKVKECAFTLVPSSKIATPMIQECPFNIECRLEQTLSLGSHDMFIGKVVAVHADNAIMTPDGRIDYTKAAPIVYNQGEYWLLGSKIGSYGWSAK